MKKWILEFYVHGQKASHEFNAKDFEEAMSEATLFFNAYDKFLKQFDAGHTSFISLQVYTI